MATIQEVFKQTQAQQRMALIGYLPAGYPTPQEFLKLAETAFCAGLDILEIGLPVDQAPLDGQVIQEAMKKVLEKGVGVDGAFQLGKQALGGRNHCGLVMLYVNLLDEYGVDKLLVTCAEEGMDGILVVGMSPDHFKDFSQKAGQLAIQPIGFVTADMTGEMLSKVIDQAGGFLYLQSQSGPTGEKGEFGQEVHKRVQMVKKMAAKKGLPVAVGFGVQQAEDVRRIAALGADGVIVGTALVKAAEQGEEVVRDLINSLSQATGFPVRSAG